MDAGGTVEAVSGDRVLRRERRQEDMYFLPFLVQLDYKQDWQPYPRLTHTLLKVLTIYISSGMWRKSQE